MRKPSILLVCAVVLLLAACELEDDLRIEADGSGTYRATVSVEKLLAGTLGRIRAAAEQQGFRIVGEGETADRRFLSMRKDFDDVHSLGDSQSNYELTVSTRNYLWRRYHLHATVGSVAGQGFDWRFSITMPARITSTSQGESNGARVTWYCTNGGTIDVEAEGFFLPFTRTHVLAIVGVAAAALLLLVALGRRALAAPAIAAEQHACRTCANPLSALARYCPACGERVLGA
jgi:hypothetical protein